MFLSLGGANLASKRRRIYAFHGQLTVMHHLGNLTRMVNPKDSHLQHKNENET